MKKNIFFILIFFILSAPFTACDLVEINIGDTPEGPPATAIMITMPYENQHFAVGEMVEVRTEANGIVSSPTISLLVDGIVYRSDSFKNTFSQPVLHQTWTPTNPGTFFLQTSLGVGSVENVLSNGVTVIVDEQEQEEISVEIIEEPEPDEECPQPIVTTTAYANCRSGPGTAYNLVWGLRPDQTFIVLAKTPSESWWKVQLNDGGAECWIWSTNTELCGNKENIPVDLTQEKDEIPVAAPEKESEEEPESSGCNCSSGCSGLDLGCCNSCGCTWDTGSNTCS